MRRLAPFAGLLLLVGCGGAPAGAASPIPAGAIDVHAHLDLGEDPRGILRGMDGTGVGLAFLCGGVRMVVEADQAPGNLHRFNGALRDACRAHPGRLRFHVLVHPARLDESLEAIDRFGSDPLAIGVGELLPVEHLNGYPFDTPAMEEIARRAARQDLPLLLHTGKAEYVRQAARLVREVPEGRYILAHAAGKAVEEGLSLMREHPNVWMDLSVHARKPGVREPLLEKGDRGRLLFGSDYPIEPYPAAWSGLRSLGFTPEEEAGIARANALRFYPRLASGRRMSR